MGNPRLTIIVVSWNVQENLLRCLQSIEMHGPRNESEVIVVDNASSDGTADAVRRSFPHVRVVANTENRGFSAANNQAIKIARGDQVFLLNPDTLVHRGALDTLTRFLEERAGVGACGPRLVDIDGHNSCSVGSIPTFRRALYRSTPLRWLGIGRGHRKKLSGGCFGYDHIADVEQLSGAAIMVRRSVLEQVGGMDERFFLYYEDVDLCLRIAKAGWRIAFVPDAVITHLGGRSTTRMSVKKRFLLYSSLLTYFRKHRGRLPTAIFALAFKPGVILKELGSVFAGSLVLVLSVPLCNRRRRSKSLAKIKDSAVFLGKYGLSFLLKA